jgi:Piwi domain
MVEEVAAIYKCCEEMSEGNEVYTPSLTFITCQKRHHTRLFAVNERDTDQSGNIPAGTVVSHLSVTVICVTVICVTVADCNGFNGFQSRLATCTY